MAINKNFVVKNGLEVATNLVFADSTTSKIGIGTTNPLYELDVRGGVGVTNLYVSGVSTVISRFNVGTGGSIFTVLGVGGSVGVGTTNPSYTLDVRGGIGATDTYTSGVATVISRFNVGTGGTILTVLGVGGSVGVGTTLPEYLLDIRSPVSTGQTALYVKGDVRITGDISIDDISVDQIEASQVNVSGTTTSTNLNVTGIATIATGVVTNLSGSNLSYSGIGTITTLNSTNGTITNLSGTHLNISGVTTLGVTTATNTTTQNLNVSGITTLGVTTATNTTTQNLNVSGVTTLGVTTATNTTLQNLNVSGISTLGTVKISSGIITASSGVVTYYGDGRYLTDIERGVGLSTSGSVIGYGATFLKFSGSGVDSIQYNPVTGIATINISGGGGGPGIVSTTSKSTVTFIASSGQTTFSLSYVAGAIDVYLNGVRLSETEYTVTNETTVVLTYPATAGDIIDIVVFDFGNSVRGIQGTNGAQGTQGVQGISGAFAGQGVQGVQGIQGNLGIQGIQGVQGISGAFAGQGIQGTTGIQGPQGPTYQRFLYSYTATNGQVSFAATYTTGYVDVFLNGARLNQNDYTATSGTSVVLQSGASLNDLVDIVAYTALSLGTQGIQGIQGVQGLQGLQGIQGIQGTQGVQGISGAFAGQGIQGIQGAQGIQGSGIQGTTGIQGSSGSQGLQGITGSGIQGTQGVQGISGSFAGQGIQGIQGIQGLQGANQILVADNPSTNSEYYITFSSNTGLTTSVGVTTSKLTFNPSTGRITAVDFNSTSDQRLKENIQPLSNSIEVLNKINPVEFSWKDTKEKSYGVIAQELENVLPELVKDREEYKSVSYIPLIALLIDTIKEHQKEIEILKLKILD